MALVAKMLSAEDSVPTITRADGTGLFVQPLLFFYPREPREFAVQWVVFADEQLLAVQDGRISHETEIPVLDAEGL